MQKSLRVSTRHRYLFLRNENVRFGYFVAKFYVLFQIMFFPRLDTGSKTCTLWSHFCKNIFYVECKDIFNSNATVFASSSLDTPSRNTNCLPSGIAHAVFLFFLPKLDVHKPKSDNNSKKKLTAKVSSKTVKSMWL